jgi:hypothetical protein
MGRLENRLSRLVGRIEPPEDEGAMLRRKKIMQALNDLATLFGREGEAIESRQAVLEEQGFSSKDAMTIAKDEIVRARNPELADFLDAPYPPEIRHDAIAKQDWLINHIEDRKKRGLAKRLEKLGG